MTIRGLNHITLATADLPRAVAFYHDALGLTLDHQWDAGAYLSAGDLWICLSFDETASPSGDYTHLAFDVAAEDFSETCDRLVTAGATVWKENRSEGDSFYFADPDGHKLELHVGNLASRLAHIAQQNVNGEIACGT